MKLPNHQKAKSNRMATACTDDQMKEKLSSSSVTVVPHESQSHKLHSQAERTSCNQKEAGSIRPPSSLS